MAEEFILTGSHFLKIVIAPISNQLIEVIHVENPHIMVAEGLPE